MIKITYDHTGNIVTIHVQTDDSFSQVPWDINSKTINWNLIDYEPTRNSIKTAWDNWAEGKDLNYELRDRPDLAPPPDPVQPNWVDFNKTIILNAGFRRICNQSSAKIEAQVLVSNCADIAMGASPDYQFLKAVWDVIVDNLNVIVDSLNVPAKPTSVEIKDLNEICDRTFMQFNIDSEGHMQLR
ncbi:hypothetical protein WA1_18840 [Scytonema hofmannii PCC 7110]|uniref:Uncharacterized protein n=1 Tax=Scytonema hofmannii PCC 7110 TaxID=128403 RepID=A0A139XBI0_9CYAN|nr:hypothetical protein [Scytonema hofmannii]KYC42060.1 hypothetical protein WA1_18840 [Scytonema hofmannii PCC 7110]